MKILKMSTNRQCASTTKPCPCRERRQMKPCSTSSSRLVYPTRAYQIPFRPPLDWSLNDLTGCVRVVSGRTALSGCCGARLKTTFPLTEQDLMSKFSRSIFPSAAGRSCEGCFPFIYIISMRAGSRWSKSRLEGRLGSMISVPTTMSSSGAISNLSSLLAAINYNITLPFHPLNHPHPSCPAVPLQSSRKQCSLILQSNKFLKPYCDRPMPSSKTRKAVEKPLSSGVQSPPERTLTRIKFNISEDTLRPFVEGSDSARTQRRRPAFSQLAPQTLRKGAKKESPAHSSPREDSSPDVPREVSNEILQKIEARGIGCAWQEVEQPRVEEGRGECEEQWQREVWLMGGPSKNSSFASTSDLSVYLSYYDYCERLRQLDPLYFQIDADRISLDARTTLMIKNIPNKYTIQLLAEEIDKEHANSYDFLYLPCDIKNNCNVGYGFVNFLDLAGLQKFYLRFQGKRWGKFKSQKICTLTYARLQGLNSLIEHFQNSKVLNHKDKKYQPIIREFASINHLLQKQRGSVVGRQDL